MAQLKSRIVALTVVGMLLQGPVTPANGGWKPKPPKSPVRTPKVDVPKVDVPKVDVPKVDVPKVDVPKVEVPKVEVPKVDMPKVGMPKVDMPKVDMPKVDVPKVDVPKVDMPKADVPKVDVPKVDVPKVPKMPTINDFKSFAAKLNTPTLDISVLAFVIDPSGTLAVAVEYKRRTQNEKAERELKHAETELANAERETREFFEALIAEVKSALGGTRKLHDKGPLSEFWACVTALDATEQESLKAQEQELAVQKSARIAELTASYAVQRDKAMENLDARLLDQFDSQYRDELRKQWALKQVELAEQHADAEVQKLSRSLYLAAETNPPMEVVVARNQFIADLPQYREAALQAWQKSFDSAVAEMMEKSAAEGEKAKAEVQEQFQRARAGAVESTKREVEKAYVEVTVKLDESRQDLNKAKKDLADKKDWRKRAPLPTWKFERNRIELPEFPRFDSKAIPKVSVKLSLPQVTLPDMKIPGTIVPTTKLPKPDLKRQAARIDYLGSFLKQLGDDASTAWKVNSWHISHAWHVNMKHLAKDWHSFWTYFKGIDKTIYEADIRLDVEQPSVTIMDVRTHQHVKLILQHSEGSPVLATLRDAKASTVELREMPKGSSCRKRVNCPEIKLDLKGSGFAIVHVKCTERRGFFDDIGGAGSTIDPDERNSTEPIADRQRLDSQLFGAVDIAIRTGRSEDVDAVVNLVVARTPNSSHVRASRPLQPTLSFGLAFNRTDQPAENSTDNRKYDKAVEALRQTAKEMFARFHTLFSQSKLEIFKQNPVAFSQAMSLGLAARWRTINFFWDWDHLEQMPPGNADSRPNAVQHCYWAALMRRDLGLDFAASILAAHDEALSEVFDRHNNDVGLTIGADDNLNDDELWQNCLRSKELKYPGNIR